MSSKGSEDSGNNTRAKPSSKPAKQNAPAPKPLASMLETSTKPTANKKKEATFFSRVVENAGMGREMEEAGPMGEPTGLKRKRMDGELAALLGEDSNSIDAYSAMMLNINAVRMPSASSCEATMNETKSNTHVFDKHDVSGTEALFSLPYDWALKTGLRCEVEEKAAGDKPYHWVEAIHRAKPLADFNDAVSQGRKALALTDEAKAKHIVSASTSFCYPDKRLPENLLELVVKNENFANLIRHANHVRYSTEKVLLSELDSNASEESAGKDSVVPSTTPTDKAFYWWRSSSMQSTAASFCYQRRHEWGQSFRSLFLKLRKCKCSFFYYIDSSFVCLFLAENTLGTCRKASMESFMMPSCAVISKSKRVFRKKLEAFGVEFSMPLNTEAPLNATEQKKNSELIDELKAFREDSDKAAVGAKVSSKLHRGNSIMDDSLQSLMTIVGNHSVTKLYNFLMNTVVKRGALSCDVPLLVSPICFLGSSVRVAETKKPSAGRRGNRPYKILRVEGTILPNCLATMAYTLHSMDSENRLELTTKAMDETKNFNVALGIVYRKELAQEEAKQSGQLFSSSHLSRFDLEKDKASAYLANAEKVL